MSYENLESNVLGSLMVGSTAWDRGGHMLRPEDFKDPENRNIFLAIRDLVAEGVTPDTIAVAEILERDKKLPDGPQYLAMLSNHAVSSANIEHHCLMLKDATIRRVIHQTALRMQTLTGSGREQLIQVQAFLSQMEAQDPREPVLLKECANEWLGILSERSEAGGEVVGRKMGFCDVDRRTGGLRPGDLIVIAGRPAMGKTALAMSSIISSCEEGQTCLKFSLEMDRAPLMDRIVANLSGVPMHLIRSPANLADGDWPRITRATARASAMPWYLDDEPSLTIQEIHSRARRIKRKHGLGLVVVDYIQLVETDQRHTSRRDHVAEVSRTLKRMAKDLQVPVIALSQLNRKCEERPDKRPLMSDLYESGSVEQDADAIGFVYRDEIYNENSPRKGICELIWRKMRNGEPGTDYLLFDGPTQQFRQADRNSVPETSAENIKKSFHNPYRKTGS